MLLKELKHRYPLVIFPNGIIGEINEYINRLKEKYLKLNVIITGGDSTFLLNKIKNAIFADQDFLAIGLNNILKYNEGH